MIMGTLIRLQFATEKSWFLLFQTIVFFNSVIYFEFSLYTFGIAAISVITMLQYYYTFLEGTMFSLEHFLTICIIPSICSLYMIVMVTYHLHQIIMQAHEFNSKLKEESAAKSAFLRTIGHELRYAHFFFQFLLIYLFSHLFQLYHFF